MSLDDEAAAFKTRLAAATQAPVLDEDEVQALTTSQLPARFTIITVTPRFGGEARGDGRRGTLLRRLVTRAVAATVHDARLLEDRTRDEFEFSEVSYETGGGDYAYSEGRYSDLTYWTYTTA